jgi:hypothetical protein
LTAGALGWVRIMRWLAAPCRGIFPAGEEDMPAGKTPRQDARYAAPERLENADILQSHGASSANRPQHHPRLLTLTFSRTGAHEALTAS